VKRDLDLIRKIMFEIEADPKLDGQLKRVMIPDYSTDEISCHIGLLEEAGLIHAVTLSGDDRREHYATGLTWQGHEFLDAIRDDTFWQRAKAKLANMAGATLPLVLEKLIKLATNL
jgi:hypothetical protein